MSHDDRQLVRKQLFTKLVTAFGIDVMPLTMRVVHKLLDSGTK